MARQSPKQLQRLQRRRQVAQMYLHAWSQAEIAAKLSVARTTVAADLRAIANDWRASAIRDFDELRLRELQKIDLLEQEAWEGWSRSQQNALIVVLSEEKQGQTTRKSSRNQVGDPRFLAQVQQCIAQRRLLLGLDVAPALPQETHDAHLTLEVRRERVVSLLAALRERDRIEDARTGSDHLQPADLGAGDQLRPLEAGAAPHIPGPDAPGGD